MRKNNFGPLVFLDTETTSLRPDREVWEVAAIRVEDGETVQYIDTMVDVTLRNHDPFSLDVGKFWERHPRGIHLSNATAHVASFLEPDTTGQDPFYLPGTTDLMSKYNMVQNLFSITAGAHIVGMVPSFDTQTLERDFREFDLSPRWHHHLIDVETMAYTRLLGVSLDYNKLPYSMTEMSMTLDVQLPTEKERHTALGDTQWTKRIWDKLVGE